MNETFYPLFMFGYGYFKSLNNFAYTKHQETRHEIIS